MDRTIKNIAQHAEVSEKAIEAYLAKRCKDKGLLCLKYFNANQTGYPDRVVCLPEWQVMWIELKTKGKKPTKLQRLRHEELRQHGQMVFVIDSKEQIDEILRPYPDKEK